MTDDEICEALGIEPGFNDSCRRSRAAFHSRVIYEVTRQWPWQWAGDFPPKKWTANMVQNLARSDEEDGQLVKPRQVDVDDEEDQKEQKDEEDADDEEDEKGEEENGIEIDGPIDEGERHNRAGEMGYGREKDGGDQTTTSAKATTSPVPTPNSESSLFIHERPVRQTNSSPPEEVVTLDHADTPSSDSTKKRARSEEPYPGPAITTPDRPAKRCRLNINESNTDPKPCTPTLEDPAETITKEKDLATLDSVVKRRRTESTLEYATLKEKADSFQQDLKTRKAFLGSGIITASESQNEVATRKKVHNDVFNNLEKLRRTIEYYEVNKDLLETLDSETRIMVAKDHGRRLGEMKKELETAATHLQEAQRKVEAEREEIRQRIKEDEAKLVDMEAGVDLARTEHDRWRCIEHFASMKADDLKKVMVGLEREGLVLPESHGKQSPLDSAGYWKQWRECKADSKASGSN
ncbi:hypothetical protein NCS52_00931200 [Fusarium sp. LHS14.1]|nr:hypothetical protein NCS52_00931200 [Fusarium sp. LHS14.1]